MTAAYQDTAAGPEALGEIRLFVPTDWFDLMADGADEDAARDRVADVVRRSYPHQDDATRADFTDAMMAWRRRLFDDGVVMDGLIAVPPGQAGAERGATWQVMAGVVELPAADPDIDLGEVMVRLAGAQPGSDTAYLESYTTDMGLGFGYLDRPVLGADGPAAVPGATTAPPADAAGVVSQVGLAVALACPPGGGRGLLVVGTCLDPGQVYGLGALVAVIAGRSVFTEGPGAGRPPAGGTTKGGAQP